MKYIPIKFITNSVNIVLPKSTLTRLSQLPPGTVWLYMEYFIYTERFEDDVMDNVLTIFPVYSTHVKFKLGFYLLSGKTSYRKISWSFEVATIGLRLLNRSKIWQAPRQPRYRDVRQIWQRYDQYNTPYHGLETSRDSGTKRHTA